MRNRVLAATVVGGVLVTGTSLGDSRSESGADTAGCRTHPLSADVYQGRHIRILAPNPPVMGEPVARHAKAFAALTGATIDVQHVGFDELYESVMLPFLSGTHEYDVLFYGSLWIADVAPYLAPLPPRVLNSRQLGQVTQTYRDIASWKGRMVQFPIDGDRHYFKYRITPFADPGIRRRFKASHGRPLSVPVTWGEYAQVAQFFNGWDWDGDDQPEYGAAEVTSTADMMVFSAFIGRAAAFAKHPEVNGGFFFDLQTMTPLINNPGWVRALENFIEAIKYMPPGGDQFTITDEIDSYGSGQVLFSNSWDDATVRAVETGSPIRDDLGFALPMGSYEVWNRRSRQWDRFDSPNRVPYIAWGWTAGVSSASENQDLAFDFLCYFKNDANHDQDISIGHTGVNPHRERDFSAAFYVDEMGWSARQAGDYVATLRAVDRAPHRILDLRVPGANLLMESMVRAIHAAKTGESTPRQALDRVAAEWREIVAEIGVPTMREAYAAVVALEDGVSDGH